MARDRREPGVVIGYPRETMNLFGPGSEWFWSMAQFLLLAATLLGLYRQLRQQNAANALHRIETLQGEWDSPRLIYARLAVAIWRKHRTSPTPDVEATVQLCRLIRDGAPDPVGAGTDERDLRSHGQADPPPPHPRPAQDLMAGTSAKY